MKQSQTSTRPSPRFHSYIRRTTESHPESLSTNKSNSKVLLNLRTKSAALGYVRSKPFLVLLWHKMVIQWHHPLEIAVFFVLPVLMILVLALQRFFVDSIAIDAIIYRDVNPDKNQLERFSLWYTPKNHSSIDKLMLEVGKFFDLKKIISFQDEYTLVEMSRPNLGYAVGIIFDNSTWVGDSIPNELEYTLRFKNELRHPFKRIISWTTGSLFHQTLHYPVKASDLRYDLVPNYYREGFLNLQSAISKTFILMKTGKRMNAVINFRTFPRSNFVEDPLLARIHGLFNLTILIISWIKALIVLRAIAREKEKRIHDYIRVSGASHLMNYMAWYLKIMLTTLFSILISSILFKLGMFSGVSEKSLFPNSSYLIVFLLIYTYMGASLSLDLIISSLCSTVSTSLALGTLLHFCYLVPFESLTFLRIRDNLIYKLISSGLLCHCGLRYGINDIILSEAIGTGVRFNNLFSLRVTEQSVTLGYILVSLLLNILWNFILLVLISHKKCIPKIVKKLRTHVSHRTNSVGVLADKEPFYKPLYEPSYNKQMPSVKVQGITKICYANVKILHDITMFMHEGQITAIVGAYNSGKSLLLAILSGVVEPTSGTINIHGNSMEESRDNKKFGYYLSDDILNEELSIDQHIDFYCSLRGINPIQTEQEKLTVYKFLYPVDMPFNKSASKLSFVDRRKLAIALAFCGGVNVVFLDDPTVGLDTNSQVMIWNMISNMKLGRTIVLATSMMDEAEELGDRLAILDRGRLHCFGSPYYLRKLANACYYLFIDIDFVKAYPNDITNMLKKYIQAIALVSSNESKLVYSIAEEYVSVFPEMLADLERHKSVFHIKQYSISVRTLEQIYMRIGGEIGVSTDGQREIRTALKLNKKSYKPVSLRYSPFECYNDNISNCSQRFQAMFLKRFLIARREWRFLAVQALFLLLILHIIVIFSSRRSPLTANDPYDLPLLPIDFAAYEKFNVLIDNNSINPEQQQIHDEIVNHLNNVGASVEYVYDIDRHLRKKKFQWSQGSGKRDLFGIQFYKNKINAWINNEAHHVEPLVLNLIHNMFLQTLDKEVKIRVNNHPLPIKFFSRVLLKLRDHKFGYSVAHALALIMSCATGFLVIFYIEERISKLKRLQFVCGATAIPFWGVAFIFEYIIYLILVTLVTATLFAYRKTGFKTLTDLGHVSLLLISFGFAAIPLVLLVSQLFSKPMKGFSGVIIYSFFGMALMTYIMDFQMESKLLNQIMTWFVLVLPQLILHTGILKYYQENIRMQSCMLSVQECMKIPYFDIDVCWKVMCHTNFICCQREENYLDFKNSDGVLWYVLLNILSGTFCIILVFIIDLVKVSRAISNRMPSKISESLKKARDKDVIDEDERVTNPDVQTFREFRLIVNKLFYFSKKASRTVNGVSMGVKPFECFGILGASNTGKTSIFKMLIGERNPTSGEIFIEGTNFDYNKRKIYRLIGYRSQIPVMFEELTGIENINIFGILRGLSADRITNTRDFLAHHLAFKEDIHQRVEFMDSNCKAKLGLMIALLGSPEVIYLDEPTSGMDTIGRRLAWRVLNMYRDNGKSIVLMSHSLTECEVLCTRIAIISQGVFKCLGTLQHLKQKLTRSIILIITVYGEEYSEDSTRKVDIYIKHNFPSCILREQTLQKLVYNYSELTGSWSRVFEVLEAGKLVVPIKEYYVGQSSLDQIYYKYTKLEIRE